MIYEKRIADDAIILVKRIKAINLLVSTVYRIILLLDNRCKQEVVVLTLLGKSREKFLLIGFSLKFYADNTNMTGVERNKSWVIKV